MVTYKNNSIESVSLEEATKDYNFVDKNAYMVAAARGLAISFGD